jgi:single-strand DNA-binding protein
MNINKVIIGGTLTRDPELRQTAGGTAVCEFVVAVNAKYKDRETATFVGCVAWGKTGEIVNRYFTKGSRIVAFGKLTQDEWTDNAGQKKSKTKVTATEIDFVDKRSESGYRQPPRDDHNAAKANGYQPQHQDIMPAPLPTQRYSDADLPPQPPIYNDNIDGDDIPF